MASALVDRLEETWAELLVNLDRCSDDPARQIFVLKRHVGAISSTPALLLSSLPQNSCYDTLDLRGFLRLLPGLLPALPFPYPPG